MFFVFYIHQREERMREWKKGNAKGVSMTKRVSREERERMKEIHV
jgi:hypothetical protein